MKGKERKGNQGHLSSAIRDFFDITQAESFKHLNHHFTEEIDKGHGRIEHRRYWLTEDLSSLKDLTDKWVGLNRVGMVESTRYIGFCLVILHRLKRSNRSN